MHPFAVPTTLPQACPIQSSLGVLGRKWALLVLRDVAFHEGPRFSDFLHLNEGLTPRVLTFRLRELQDEGFIERVEVPDEQGHRVTYALTAKGHDTIPILAAFMGFGIKHHARQVFADGCPRTLGELLPSSGRKLLGPLLAYAQGAPASG